MCLHAFNSRLFQYRVIMFGRNCVSGGSSTRRPLDVYPVQKRDDALARSSPAVGTHRENGIFPVPRLRTRRCGRNVLPHSFDDARIPHRVTGEMLGS